MQRMTDMLPQGHCLSIMGWREARRCDSQINVPEACRSFRSDQALVGQVVVVRLNPRPWPYGAYCNDVSAGARSTAVAATRVSITIRDSPNH